MIYIILFFILIIIIYILLYNSIISARQLINEAWADIDVQLQRRHDLIPNLISTTKGYAHHEAALFEQITQLRTIALSLDKNDISGISTVEKQLEDGVHALFALVENYPDLKANTSFLQLQNELVRTEDQIASARRIYNGNTAYYNTRIKLFPLNIIAKVNHFTESSFFQKDS